MSRAEALMDRTVLGVHRDDFGSRGLAHPGHDRTAGDDRLLVGQGQSAASFECGQGDRQPGKPHDPVHHHVGHGGDRRQAVGAGYDLDARRQPRGQLCSQ